MAGGFRFLSVLLCGSSGCILWTHTAPLQVSATETTVCRGQEGELALRVDQYATNLSVTAIAPDAEYPLTFQREGRDVRVFITSSLPAGTFDLRVTDELARSALLTAVLHVSNDASCPSSVPLGVHVTGLAGSGLVLREPTAGELPISMDGRSSFPSPISVGAEYHVVVAAQPTAPWQTCVITPNDGIASAAEQITIEVVCATNQYHVGGDAIGVVGTGLVIKESVSGATLAVAAESPFVFASSFASGAAYALEVEVHPSSPAQTCMVANATGIVAGADVLDIEVSCATNLYSVSVNVSGISGATELVLTNNGNDPLSISGDGRFTFSTPLSSGLGYDVAVQAHPFGAFPPRQCQVVDGAGFVGDLAPAPITVTCGVEQRRFAYVTNTNANSIAALILDGSTGRFRNKGSWSLDNAKTLVAHPSGRFVFAIGGGSDVHTFAVDTRSGMLRRSSVSPFGPSNSLAIERRGRFLYGGGIGEVVRYLVDSSTGRLTWVETIPSGTGAVFVAVNPSGDRLYAASSGSNSIRAWSIGTGGELTAVFGSPFASGGAPGDIFLERRGGFAYIVRPGVGDIGEFAIGVGGALTMSPGGFGLGSAASGIAEDPLGRVLYAASSGAGKVYSLPINGAGASLGGSVASSGAVSPRRLVAEPEGDFLYALDASGMVARFAIGPTGGLLFSESLPMARPGDADIALVNGDSNLVDTPTFAYVATGTQDILAYRIDPTTGMLTHLPGAGVASPDGGSDIAAHPNGRTLYVSNHSELMTFSIDTATGTLTKAGSSAITGAAAISIDRGGQCLYVDASGGRVVFALDPITGAVGGTGVLGAGGAYPFGLDPLGEFALEARFDASVQAYSVHDSNCTLSGNSGPVATSGSGVTAYGPNAIASDPFGRFSYVAHDFVLPGPGAGLSSFAWDRASGELRGIGSTVQRLSYPLSSIEVDPLGRFAYATSFGSSRLLSFAIDPTNGALSPIDDASTVQGPLVATVDVSGRYLLLLTSGALQSMSIQSNGVPIFVSSVPVFGFDPRRVVTVGELR